MKSEGWRTSETSDVIRDLIAFGHGTVKKTATAASAATTYASITHCNAISSSRLDDFAELFVASLAGFRLWDQAKFSPCSVERLKRILCILSRSQVIWLSVNCSLPLNLYICLQFAPYIFSLSFFFNGNL